MVRSGLWLVSITASWQRGSSLVAGLTLQVLPVGSLAHIHKTPHEQGSGVDSPLRAMLSHQPLPVHLGTWELPHDSFPNLLDDRLLLGNLVKIQILNHTPDPLTLQKEAPENPFLIVTPGDSYHQKNLKNNYHSG